MKLHTLTLNAFGPFPGTEAIDFDALSEDGLFLLHGRTGSGKTFILDAVTFALYGQVAGERGVTRLRSDHAAPGAVPRVVLEFTLAGRRYRITRSPQHMRPKQRGEGYVQENQRAHLEVWESGAWTAAANGSQAVGKELGEILPLDRHQFTKVILLPQGDFAEFLHSSSSEKQQLLERLFDTALFQNLEDLLREQAREARAQVEETNREIEAQTAAVLDGAQQLTGIDFSEPAEEKLAAPVPGEATEPAEDAAPGEEEEAEPEEEPAVLGRRITAQAQRQREELLAHAEKSADEQSRTQEHADELAARRRQLVRYAEHREQRREHDLQSESIEAERESLARHSEAAALEQWFRSAEKAEQDSRQRQAAALRKAEDAQQILAAQEDIPARVLLQEEIRAEELQQARRELTELQGRLRDQDAEKLEAEQHRLDRRDRELTVSIRAHRESLSAWEREEKELAAELAAAEDQLRDPEEVDQEREAARAEQERLAARVETRRELAAVRQKHADEQRRVQTKAAEAEKAAAVHEQALDQHLKGIAAELSGSLLPGEPCLVCGSAEHPRPAAPEEQAVSRTQVREALSAAEEAAAARTAAESSAGALQERLAALAETLGEAAELTVEDCENLLRTAREDLARAETARKAQQELRTRVEKARTALAEIRQKRATTQGALTLDLSEQERTGEDSVRVEAALADLRGPHSSVRERTTALIRLEEALEAAESARRQAQQAAHQAETAAEEARQKLAGSGFEDRSALQEALLEDQEQQERRQRVQSWDRAELRLQEEAKLEEVLGGRRRAEAGEQDPGEEAVAEAAEQAAEAARQHQESARALDRFDDRFEQLRRGLKRLEERLARRREHLAEQVRRSELAETINGRGPDNRLGMTLTTFVLAARLERVAEAATRHLQVMSEGRYRLLHDDTKRGGGLQGLELKVTDQHSDEERPTSSLSGGETFMASLAMALGLAEVVQAGAGGIGLESLFIDEGFGSLDEETLEHVMAALVRLQGEGRRVGVVSHVTEMHKAIPVQLRVIKHPSGSSTRMQLAGRTA